MAVMMNNFVTPKKIKIAYPHGHDLCRHVLNPST